MAAGCGQGRAGLLLLLLLLRLVMAGSSMQGLELGSS